MSEDFVKSNSMAVWGLESDTFLYGLRIKEIEGKSIEEIEKHFQTDYLDKDSNKEKPMNFDTDWLGQLNTKRVIVRAIPSADENGNDVPDNTLYSFHWYKKNRDYRLASALYNTEFWGGFITNLNNDTRKKPDEVNKSDVKNLFNRIDKDARILAFGLKAFNAFEKYLYNNDEKYTENFGNEIPRSINVEGHVVTYIPSYSGDNEQSKENTDNKKKQINSWNTLDAHNRILDAEKIK